MRNNLNYFTLNGFNSQTPTTNNSNTNSVVSYGNNSEQVNDGLSAAVAGVGGGIIGGGQMPTMSTTGGTGVYIPIPMTTGAPPQPYGIFAGTHQTPGMGMHPNYMTGPPPQIITHCGLPPPQPTQLASQQTPIQNNLNTATGSDNIDNIINSEMSNNNGANIIGIPPPGMQIQCPNYPPPMPFYYSTNSVNTMGANSIAAGGGGSGVGPMTSSANGVHLVAPFSHQITPTTPSNQTAFAAPHSALASTQVN